MERQATQPVAMPAGRKRRRVCKKPKGGAQPPASDLRATRDLEMPQNGLSPAEALDMKATQPPTSELVLALKALHRAEDPLPPPTPSPIHELMEGTLKDYEEECVEEGTFHSDPATEVGEWEVQDWTRWKPSSTISCMNRAPFIPIDSLNVSTPDPILVH